MQERLAQESLTPSDCPGAQSGQLAKEEGHVTHDAQDPWAERVAAVSQRVEATRQEALTALEERTALAREMRATGMTWREVGERLDITYQRAMQIAREEG